MISTTIKKICNTINFRENDLRKNFFCPNEYDISM